jgi:hypothetical protein
MYGDIQYVTDTFLIERILESINSDYSINRFASFTKKAEFDIGSILSAAKTNIASVFGGEDLKGLSPENRTSTILKFLAPAFLFRLNPLLWVAYEGFQLLSKFGLIDVNLDSIYEKIKSTITPSLESGKSISPGEINDSALSMLGTVVASYNSILFIKQAELDLIKTADGNIGKAWKDQPLMPNMKNNWFIRLFQLFGKGRCSNIIVGLFVWLIKTALLSAGLLAVGGAASSILGVNKPSEDNYKQEGSGQSPIMISNAPKSTGFGSKVYKINPGDLWLENLYGDSIEDRVLQWAVQSYPQLNQYQDIILRTPSFKTVVSRLSQNYRSGQQQISIPDPYKKVDDVLSVFIGDVFNQIKVAK